LDGRSIDDGKVVTEKVNKTGYGVTNFWLDYQVPQYKGYQ
jgi:hypothetical protein